MLRICKFILSIDVKGSFIWILILVSIISINGLYGQVVINEGSNKSYLTGVDEDGEAEDWIEIYNVGPATIDLDGYGLSDNDDDPFKYSLSGLEIGSGEFKRIFCSEKNRYETAPFQHVSDGLDFSPVVGWNTHDFTSTFEWDGVSNIIINVCSYLNTGYTENAVFLQTATPYVSTVAAFNDGSDASCSAAVGYMYAQRPNLQINGITIDEGVIQNTNTDYPAPYGNWYWSARHQILVHADELIAAGVTPGAISSIGFQVASTNVITYTYVDVSLIATTVGSLDEVMLPVEGFSNHTNFKIDAEGETIYLSDPSGIQISSLYVESPQADISIGRYPDAAAETSWMSPTPGSTNNIAALFADTLMAPVLSAPSGLATADFYLSMANPNTFGIDTKIVYTLDGSDPVFTSPTLNGVPFLIDQTTVVRAKIFPVSDENYLPSVNAYGTYLFNVEHTTPIIMVTTDIDNLYGSEGIFDNYNFDWIKAAHVAYLTKEAGHPLLFETRTAMRMDGGAGGSRSNPQHSFRLTFDHAALGEETIHEPLIPNIPFRSDYSDIYLRNGSNQWLTFPQKDACQVSMMSKGTDNYYSAMEPVSVYINGEYFGLYELREKFNTEYFDVREDVIKDSVEILSMSFFYNLVLRALEGSVDHFYADYDAFNALDPMDANYMALADQYFDLAHYTDYIIAESWMGNTDWPGNNIKIYRSDKTNYRWRFALIDLELSLMPNSWTTCSFDHINYMLSQSTDNPYINIWLQSIQNETYKLNFINRFADLMNTSYLIDTLLATEQAFYDKMVPEMPNEYARWGDPFNIEGQMTTFEENHTTFQQQLACRSDKVRGDLEKAFDLEKEVEVSLAVFPDSAGSILLNTIHPQVYPWHGIYFDGAPITLTAVADSGYFFVQWLPNPFIADTLNPTFTSNITSDTTTFTAIFKSIPPPEDGPTIEFIVYPSPAEDLITLSHNNATLATGAEFTIYDIQGRQVGRGNVSEDANSTLINISSLQSAIYYIRVQKDMELMDVLPFVKM